MAGKVRIGSSEPLLPHLFSKGTLAPILATALSAYFGLAQLRLPVDGPEFWVAVALGLLLGLFSWIAIAAESRNRARYAADMMARLQELSDVLERQMPSVPQHLEDLSKKTNLELRLAAADLAAHLRRWEGDLEGRRTTMRFGTAGMDVNSDEFLRVWRQRADDSFQASQLRQRQFHERFRPMVVALRDEIRNRLGIFPPYPKPQLGEMALHLGMMIGAWPAYEMASALEALARRLPD